MDDAKEIAINFDLIRFIEPIPGGVRVHFGIAPADKIDIAGENIPTLFPELF